MRGVGLSVALALTLAGLGRAQDRPPNQGPAAPAAANGLVPWAPTWKVGVWWTVTVWQRDTQERTRSPLPAEGGEPTRPEAEREPIPGYPPLRDGVPVGFKPGNRFRFEVVRRENVRYPDDPPDMPPEEFWVVRARTLEGKPERVAELWFAVADLTLAKVVIDPEQKQRVHQLKGTALLHPEVSLELGFPLDWPDLRAAAQERAVIEVSDRPTIEQRMRKQGPDTWQLRLAPLPEEEGQEPPAAARVNLLWKQGDPFWSRLSSAESIGRLDEAGQGSGR